MSINVFDKLLMQILKNTTDAYLLYRSFSFQLLPQFTSKNTLT